MSEIKKFRKKPAVIEAMQLAGNAGEAASRFVAAVRENWASSLNPEPSEAEVEAAAGAARCVWSIPDDSHPNGDECHYPGACRDQARAMLTAAHNARKEGQK